MTADAYGLTGRRWFERFSASQWVSDLLTKRWMEAVVPVLLLTGTTVYFLLSAPAFASGENLPTLTRLLAEIGLLALGLTIVMIAGSIDISVGAMFGLVNIIALMLFEMLAWPVVAVAATSIAAGMCLGAVNGVLVAYAKTRPLITTLVTLLLFHSVARFLDARFSSQLAVTIRRDPSWSWLAGGTTLGLPTPLFLLAVVALAIHVILTRTRFGWRLTAVGSSRTAARRVGIDLRKTVLATFLSSGALAGLAGLLQAARLEQSSSGTGIGLEFSVLTAVVLGGVSLAGGRGTAARALIGALAVTVISQGFGVTGQPRELYNMTLAAVLLLFITFDLKWGKNREKALQKISLVPARLRPGHIPDVKDPNSVWAPNERLAGAEPIGLGVLDGPEDVILDDDGRLYCGDRRGMIWRFSGEDFSNHEVFARIGGWPLGLAFDHAGNLLACVAGMGLYSVSPDGAVQPLVTEAKRTWTRLYDDSPVRLADDLDVGPDGKIYFSDASVREDASEWHLMVIGAQPRGRLLCYDPSTKTTSTLIKNYPLPNGVCLSHDGKSLLINSTVIGRVDRYWLDGPRRGELEPFLENLPGMPDNVNRASDGCYWLAFVGMRTPTFDMALRRPDFRRRMMKTLPMDEWILPNMNTSCVAKVTETGEVVECLWDMSQTDHAVISSMREHDGYL